MSQNLEKTELGIRSVISIVAGAMGLVALIYTQVIIPIKDIQTRLLSIESTLSSENDRYNRMENKIDGVSQKLNDHIINKKI